MNAIKFETTRYGYRAFVGGALWQIRRVTYMGMYSEPALYQVFTEDDIEAYTNLPTFYGDLIDVRGFLTLIARDYADCMAS